MQFFFLLVGPFRGIGVKLRGPFLAGGFFKIEHRIARSSRFVQISAHIDGRGGTKRVDEV